MATILHVYGDESGTMPIYDDGDIFLFACIAIPGNVAISKRNIGKIQSIVDYLGSINGTPFVGIIQPHAGYGVALSNNITKMDVMAMLTRKFTEANVRYIPKEGIAVRNWIWMSCAQQTISATIRNSLNMTRVDHVRVILDDKSLPVEFKCLMRSTISNVPNAIRYKESDSLDVISEMDAAIESNMLFTGKDISVSWRDESLSDDDANGLTMAHALANKARRYLVNNALRSPFDALRDAGYELNHMNLTEYLTRPLSQQSIADWEKNTGLREPQL